MQERQEPHSDDLDGIDTPDHSTAHTATPTATPRAKRRRWLRALVVGFLLLVLAVVIVLTLAWRWAGQADSLASTLGRVAGWMPADQKLEATGVQGSLRHGGRIEWLRWSSPAMQVEIKDADTQWRLQPLLQRALHLGKVQMQELRIQSSPQPKDDTPTEPLQSLLLPLDIDLPFNIRRLVWEGPPAAEIQNLEGHYRFAQGEHQLQVSSLNYVDGSYTAKATLQGAAPMQLQAEATARVKAPLPQQPDQWLQVAAQAQVKGTLAGADARLQVQAQAHTEEAQGAQAAQSPLSADVQATLRPWQAQPIEQASADLQHVDLALLVPGTPHTDLSGTVQAGPQAAGTEAGSTHGWALNADITNALPGAWDQQRLPVRAVRAQAQFDGQQLWTLQEARIDLPQARDGSLQAQGSFNADTGAIEGQAQLQAVNPASIYSSLDAAPLSGELRASTDAQQQVQFTLDVRAPEGRSNAALRIDRARAQGTWAAPLLTLQALHLQALQATVDAPALRFNTETQQLHTQATLQVPGAALQLDGHIAPNEGQGQLQLQLRAAEQLAQWLQRLPGLNNPLGGAQLQGNGDVAVQWKGGWQDLQQRLANPAAPVQASALHIHATAQVPQLRYTPAGSSPSTVRNLKLQAQGTPQALDIALQTDAQLAEQLLQLHTQLQAGLSSQRNAHAMDWQANIRSLSAQWQANAASAPWKAELTQAVQVQQRHTGNPVRTARIEASASSLHITPPAAFVPEASRPRPGEPEPTPIGPAAIQWQPVLLQQSGSGAWAVRSEGALQHIPLDWVNAFSPDPQKPLLSSAGLGGNLIVQGSWDINTTERQPRARVVVERSSGDLRLAVEDTEAAPITVIRSSGATSTEGDAQTRRVLMGGRGMTARLQALRIQAELQGQTLQAQVLCKSERAGELEADVRTQLLQTKDGAWQLPEQAPLAGRIQARLPNIGVWAMFAPPGWRVAGSMNADVQLSGTRSAPQWSGSLGADGLSIVSMVDGVDLNDGRLRAQLQGTQLHIQELFLRGGHQSQARVLGMSGNLTPPPTESGTLTGSGTIVYDPQAPSAQSGIRMDLQFQAQALQVLSRADRQLSVSGNVRAGMHQGQVTLRGDLNVDRAAILLADASAPKLDSDVYVHTAASRQAAADALAKAQAQADPAAPEGSVQAAKPVDIDVSVTLGRDFALQGFGITTRLEGELQVLSGPRLLGEIRTVQGRYRAWGQSLDVQSGTIRFNGPLDNPSLEIYAVRPNIEVEAGVKITGSASAPRVGLFSEPVMSDAEILSWVVMGRDPASGGAETALLQQAAMALLSGGGTGGNIAGQLGLDEIGFKGAAEGSDAESAAITVGKRLTKDLYVAYEQSLSGAMGTLLIFYDLSRSLTLRAQTGEQSAVDLIYTRKKD